MKMKIGDLNILDIGSSIGMVGVMMGDEERTFLVPFPDQFMEKTELHGLDLDIEDWKKMLRQMDLLEVEILEKMEDGTIGKAIVRKTQRLIETRISWNVFRRDEYTCRYCGRNDVPLTVDHLVLWEEGGPSIEENLAASCKKCNKTRGCTPYEEWLEHPYYKKVSMNIGVTQRGRNRDVVDTLDAIPRNLHQRSRGKKKKR